MASPLVSPLLVKALVALVGYYLATTLYQWHRLRKVPGPFLAGFSYLWVLSSVWTGDQTGIYRDLAKKYDAGGGGLVRVGPNDIITDDPEILKRMSRARSPYGKDTYYRFTIRHPEHDNMFSTVDVAAHDRIKAKMAGPYGGRETVAMEPIVDELVEALVRHIRDKARLGLHDDDGSDDDDGRGPVAVDLAPISTYFTMDVITRVAFGKEMGFLRTDSDVSGILAHLTTVVRGLAAPLAIPPLRGIMDSRVFQKLFRPKSTDSGGMGLLLGICEKAVNYRYQPGSPDENDLLGAFVRQGIPQELCVSESVFTIGAGTETTASAIRSTMLSVITLPRVYNKLKQTISEAVKSGLVSNPIRHEEAKTLPYLQAIIYEGLRMRPPIPVMLPKIVPPEGDTLNGVFIPGGTAVGWNLHSLMGAPRHFGPDADRFRPERFLEADKETRTARERLVEMVFGYGRFACAGKPLAMMELSKVFFELFRHFDFQIANPEKPLKSEFFNIYHDHDFLVHVEESYVG